MSVEEQLKRFDSGSAGLPGVRNLSNSGAILLHPQLRTDWVRPGVMLYGGTPGGKTAEEYGLKPVMTLSSEIIQIQNINEGDSVGYGSIFTATGPMKIGVVACGYADGYPRMAPEGTHVIVRWRENPSGRARLDGYDHGRSDACEGRPRRQQGNPVGQ